MKQERDDQEPYAQALVISQTCWEYRNLLDEERGAASRHLKHAPGSNSNNNAVIEASELEAPKAAATAAAAAPLSRTSRRNNDERGGKPEAKRTKIPRPAPPPPQREHAPAAATGTTTALETLRLAGKGEGPRRGGLWDIFVLVLQSSGLQQITSKAGSEVDLVTLLVADGSFSFFKLTLWARAARGAGRLIRPGDLVRFNGVVVSAFRGTVQASSTRRTSFRVVWRGDAFTTPQDAPSNTLFPEGGGGGGIGSSLPSSTGSEGRRRLPPVRVPSQDDALAVPREEACALAAWAKNEFPSVTSTTGVTNGRGDAGGATGSADGAGSLAAVRKGVETTVRACVLEASEAERLWMWESVRGERRKDLVARATAVLTDGEHEMTLQLWGDMASDEIVRSLREGAIAAAATAATPASSPAAATGVAATGNAPAGATESPPPVFEFTRLQPSFSFSCEALVLNGRVGKVRRLEHGSAAAVPVSAAVAAAIAAGHDEEDHQRSPWLVRPANISRAGAARFLVEEEEEEEGGPEAVRSFESVAALMSADGFSGAGYLSNVVVRKVDAPSFLSPAPPGKTGMSSPRSPGRDEGSWSGGCYCADNISALPHSLPPLSARDGGEPPVVIYLSDAEDSGPTVKQGLTRSSGAEAVLRVAVDGGALGDLLGCLPDALLAGPTAVGAARRVVKSLLEGLEVGGEQGERVDAVLACSAAVDMNGQIIATSYRLTSLEPKFASVG